MPIIDGNAQGTADYLVGTAGDDLIRGFSGNDILLGGRGDDTIIGGYGEDVMQGGLDDDTFVFSAGHITDDSMDIITDFDIRQHDKLQFLDSDGAALEIMSICLVKSTIETMNGFDLRNNIDYGTDIVFTIRNAATGDTQQVLLLDAWSGGMNAQWEAYLNEQFGRGFDGYCDDADLYYNLPSNVGQYDLA
ncbi:MAG: hypothetical protein KDK26_17325 [Roseivivax sp.]|nr:hypothetical protein [Roseivivax sp.]